MIDRTSKCAISREPWDGTFKFTGNALSLESLSHKQLIMTYNKLMIMVVIILYYYTYNLTNKKNPQNTFKMKSTFKVHNSRVIIIDV